MDSLSIENSGHLVLEIEITLKRKLYEYLGSDGLNLKEWLQRNASIYILLKMVLNMKMLSQQPVDVIS